MSRVRSGGVRQVGRSDPAATHFSKPIKIPKILVLKILFEVSSSICRSSGMAAVIPSSAQIPFFKCLHANKNPNSVPKPTSKTQIKPSGSFAPSTSLGITAQNQSNLHHEQKQHKDLLVESFHFNNSLKNLIKEISREGSDPVGILERDGDWTKDQLWPVVVLLLEDERVDEALQVCKETILR